MKSKCTNCNTEFEAEPKREVVDGITVCFFECNECRKRWLIYVEDEEVSKGIEKVQKLHKKVKELPKGSPELVVNRAQKKVDNQVRRNRELMKYKIEVHSKIVEKVLNKPKQRKQ